MHSSISLLINSTFVSSLDESKLNVLTAISRVNASKNNASTVFR